MDNSKNTKELFRIVNNLTGCTTHNSLPQGKTNEDIAEGFAEFFSNKIIKIWQSFTGTLQYYPEETNTPKCTSFRAVKRESERSQERNNEYEEQKLWPWSD